MATSLISRVRSLPYWQRVVWIMFVAQFVSALGMAFSFPFFPLYVKDLGTHTSISIEFWAGAVFSAQAFTMMLVSPFWGAVADRYGRKPMMQRALLGGSIILGMMAFVGSAEELVLLRAIQGCITGTIGAANSLVAACTPRERTGYAMGVLTVGQWGGIAIGPIIGGPLADAFGFRIPQLITAALLLLAGILVQFWIKEDFKPELRAANKQKSIVGEYRHILGLAGVSQTYTVSFMGALSRSMIGPIAPLFVATLIAGNLGAMSTVYDSFGLYASFPHIERALNGGSHVSTITGLVAGIASAATTFSAVYFGRLGDRIGHRRVLILCGVMALISFIPQIFVTSAWQLIGMQALTGLAAGGLISAPAALLARYTEPGQEGAVYGLDNSVNSAGRTISPMLGGAIAAWLGYRAAFASMIGVYALIIVVAVVLLPKSEETKLVMRAKPAQKSVTLPADLQPEPAVGD